VDGEKEGNWLDLSGKKNYSTISFSSWKGLGKEPRGRNTRRSRYRSKEKGKKKRKKSKGGHRKKKKSYGCASADGKEELATGTFISWNRKGKRGGVVMARAKRKNKAMRSVLVSGKGKKEKERLHFRVVTSMTGKEKKKSQNIFFFSSGEEKREEVLPYF